MTSTLPSDYEADDATLLARWRDHAEETAFNLLWVRHSHLVIAAARRRLSPDPEEAAQAVFMVLAQRPGVMGDPSRLAGWLLGTTRKVVANQRRLAANRHHHEQESAVENARQNHIKPNEPIWDDVRPLLDDALLELSPRRREAVVRFYLEGRSQRQIATDLECSIDAVKNRIQEGLAKLRTALNRRGIALGSDALVTGLMGETASHTAPLGYAFSAVAKGTAQAVRMAQITAHTASISAANAFIVAAASLAVLCVGVFAYHAVLEHAIPGKAAFSQAASAPAGGTKAPLNPPTPVASWTPAAPTIDAYVGPMTLVLANGQVLVLSGEDESTFNGEYDFRLPDHPINPGGFFMPGRNNPELFDPVHNTWVAAKPMSDARQSNTYTATLLADGTVLAAGGCVKTGDDVHQGPGYIAGCEIYDPHGNQWHGTAPLRTPRREHAAVLLHSGQVLVAGGISADDANRDGDSTSCELYDPTKQIWTPTAPMHSAHNGFTLVVLKSGAVLAAGGETCELYDPTRGTWTATGAMVTPRRGHSATVLGNGTVLVVGGRNATQRLSSCELYDPKSGTWSATGALAQLRECSCTALLPSGQVIVVGGDRAPVTLNIDGESQALNTCELYDPTAGTWGPAPSLLTKRCCHSLTVLPSGGLLVVGGITEVQGNNLVGITSCERMDGFVSTATQPGTPTK